MGGAFVSTVFRYDTSRSWPPFDMFGPSTLRCPDMRILGEGDEEKRICWTPSFEKEDCVIFSLGSNNQWTFEENVVKETKCKIHTFDCTVFDPRPPEAVKPRVTFYPLCLADHEFHRGALV